MKWFLGVLVGLFIVAVLVFSSGAFFIIDESEQVVITMFGDPVGDPLTEAGLHFKLPFLHKARYFEKRLLEWDGDPKEVPTKGKKYIWIDTMARWKITNALLFLQSVANETGAHGKLDNIINSAVRDAIAGNYLIEAVRNSDRILEHDPEDMDVVVASEAAAKVQLGRERLEEAILREAQVLAPQYGIDLVDVHIKRINYNKDVRHKVYQRMVSERKRAAERYRSEGQGKRAEVEGLMGKELKLITSEAYRKAQIIKGTADAEAVGIYAEAYREAPDFYSFMKTLETYQDTIDQKTTVILTTDSDYYIYLKSLDAD